MFHAPKLGFRKIENLCTMEVKMQVKQDCFLFIKGNDKWRFLLSVSIPKNKDLSMLLSWK